MILVDRRIGSKDLVLPLKQAGAEAELTELDYADCAFVGRGEKDTQLDIGIELKTLPDLIGSLRSGRLAGHQLPGLIKTYDYVWLVVEGMWRSDEQGKITTYKGPRRGWQVLPGRMTSSELEKHLLTLELRAGIHVRHTNSRRDTVRFIANLHWWWTDSAFDQHRSHLAIHTPSSIIAISDFRRAVSMWPGIGVRTSLFVEREFGSSIQLASTSPVSRWAAIEVVSEKGRRQRLGTPTAEKIVRFLKGQA